MDLIFLKFNFLLELLKFAVGRKRFGISLRFCDASGAKWIFGDVEIRALESCTYKRRRRRRRRRQTEEDGHFQPRCNDPELEEAEETDLFNFNFLYALMICYLKTGFFKMSNDLKIWIQWFFQSLFCQCFLLIHIAQFLRIQRSNFKVKLQVT